MGWGGGGVSGLGWREGRSMGRGRGRGQWVGVGGGVSGLGWRGVNSVPCTVR